MNNKVKPALIGGVVLGLLSVIPFINWGNFCCCLWAILGGMLASYSYIKKSPTPASAGDGALLGLIAGVVGGLIVIIIGIPVELLVGTAIKSILVNIIASANPSQAEMMRDQMMTGVTVARTIINQIIAAIFLLIFSVLGGLLAIPIFEKRKGTLTPPPPPSGVGGNYAAN
jgi:hypothetical protein